MNRFSNLPFAAKHLAFVVALLLPVTSLHAGIVVDGSLGDWGVTVGHSSTGGSTYSGVSATPGLLNHMIEDTNDLRNDYYVGPNYGGQNYDAEFLGAAVQDGKLVISVMSGQRTDNTQNATGNPNRSLFAPGDIRITTGSGRVVGLEVGGFWHGHAGNDGLIQLGDAGTTYALDSNGYTIGAQDGLTSWGVIPSGWPNPYHSVEQTAGSLWLDAYWIPDPIQPPTDVQFSKQFLGGTGTKLGMADSYVFKQENLGDQAFQHSVIEMAIDLRLFDALGGITAIDWSPSCGNDTLHVDVMLPEPASIAIWGLIPLAALVVRSRRKLLRRNPS
jgi:hypothetical protein